MKKSSQQNKVRFEFSLIILDPSSDLMHTDDIFLVLIVDIPFPKTFIPVCKKILTRLFRVFVHVYIHHFDRLVTVEAEAHVNTCYRHFYYFVTEFDLISPKEFEPLVSENFRLS